MGYRTEQGRCEVDNCPYCQFPIRDKKPNQKQSIIGFYPYCKRHFKEFAGRYKATRVSWRKRARETERCKREQTSYRSKSGPIVCVAHRCDIVSDYILCSFHRDVFRKERQIDIKCPREGCKEPVPVRGQTLNRVYGHKRPLCEKHSMAPTRIRGKCIVDGCFCFQMIKSKRNSRTYYRRYCYKHWRSLSCSEKIGTRLLDISNYLPIKTNTCSLCGWDLAVCDKHRMEPGISGGTYTRDNILVVCPNCHRLLHKGYTKEQIAAKLAKPRRTILLGSRMG